jgi:hypothetical protein
MQGLIVDVDGQQPSLQLVCECDGLLKCRLIVQAQVIAKPKDDASWLRKGGHVLAFSKLKVKVQLRGGVWVLVFCLTAPTGKCFARSVLLNHSLLAGTHIVVFASVVQSGFCSASGQGQIDQRALSLPHVPKPRGLASASHV